jgi:hypothetical protein
MFLELSFDSRAGGKESVSAPRAKSSSRYDRDDKHEMSLDELISDFHQSASSPRSKINSSLSGSEASPLRAASPPKHSKATKSDKKSWGFADRALASKRNAVKSNKAAAVGRGYDDDSSEDDGAVTPIPRLEQVLRNRPSLLPKRRAPATAARPRPVPTQRRKPPPRSPVLSSPSLSPVTSSSAASSPLSVSEAIDMPATPAEEDSIDALIGKDIRDLNNLISSGGRLATTRAARSPTTDEIPTVLRQSTRFRKEQSTRSRSPLRLDVPRGRSRLEMPESPPPPPPPEDEEGLEGGSEEDSFAEEIRKLRESRRSMPTQVSEKEATKAEPELESAEICATAALRVRNASNAINGLLLEALKPFEDRQREEEQAKAQEEENAGADAAIRKAATAELQSATQTIVLQLDLAFADMAERRKADLKADADAAAVVKETEKKEKEAAETKKKAEEKEAKEREMEILRLIPMRGKLLTCSAEIENVLDQLERADTSEVKDSTSTMKAAIEALRSRTQRRVEDLEAQMSAKQQQGDGVSWRALDWARDTLGLEQPAPLVRGDNQLGRADSTEEETPAAETEGCFEDVIQRQVLEALDLTMLRLKHVLAIDTKEAAEAQETQQRENEEKGRKLAQQQLEDERKRREAEDAETARRRVMGITSVEEVEGWAEEGWQLQGELEHNRCERRLMASLENRMGSKVPSVKVLGFSSSQDEALQLFDRFAGALVDHQPAEDSDKDFEPQPTGDYLAAGIVARMASSRARRMSEMWGPELSSSSDGDEDYCCISSGRPALMRRKSIKPTSSTRPVHRSSPEFDTRREKLQQSDGLPERHDALFPSEGKRRRRGRGATGRQQEMARTIKALQAERRQKTSWIQNRRSQRELCDL